jgi:hypothetical protein
VGKFLSPPTAEAEPSAWSLSPVRYKSEYSARSALQAVTCPPRISGWRSHGALRPLKACFSMGRAGLRDNSIPAPKGWLSEEPSPFRIPKHVQGR